MGKPVFFDQRTVPCVTGNPDLDALLDVALPSLVALHSFDMCCFGDQVSTLTLSAGLSSQVARDRCCREGDYADAEPVLCGGNPSSRPCDNECVIPCCRCHSCTLSQRYNIFW